MKSTGRPIHFQHFKHVQYLHTYCGLINFQGYRAWPFSRTRNDVTCKRCKWTLKRDERVVSYTVRLAMWAKKKAKKAG
jgi:hypothetical protein